MSKNLVLVESPSKAKTINKYLGSSYKVEATIGHIRNLPKTKLGVEIDKGFEPQLLNIRGKGDIIKRIKELSKKSTKIYIATDPDREGEAIAQDIVDILDKNSTAKIYRVLFHEITKTAVKNAMNQPLELDEKLVISQRARRVMDRIIGYKLSPFLWQTILDEASSSLSAGRVQSVSLRLICEREELINAFVPVEYWSVYGDFKNSKGDIFTAKLFSIDGKTIKILPNDLSETEQNDFFQKNTVLNKDEIVKNIVDEIKKITDIYINDISSKELRRNPSPPFITSSLQAEASRRLKFRPRKTMQIAQSLYEGIDLAEEGLVGLITYMRTDSTRLNSEIVEDARNFIEKSFGREFKPEQPKNYDKKKSNVQDAHEAIRPTSVKYSPEFVKPYLTDEQFRLYSLIWKRFIASQMEAAILETTTVSVNADKFVFKASGTIIRFNGFLQVYEEVKEDNNQDENDEEDSLLPASLEVNQNLNLFDLKSNQHFTKPPARFTESTLIKELEENGIGRPSTYASIVSTIQDRNYVETLDRKFFPTSLGKRVNEILVANFSNIFNVSFTAEMEEELDQIATGDKGYLEVLQHFYNPFIKNLESVEKTIEKPKCDKCNSDMEIKIGRFGKFLACTNYPECKNIKSINISKKEKDEPEFTGDDCPKCNSKLVIRNSRYGKFIGCEKYPYCDYTKQITLDIECPECKQGNIVTRRTKKGKTFFGCSRYPDCNYSSWTLPKQQKEEIEQVEEIDEF